MWHHVVGRLEAEVAARGVDEASAVCSAARGRPDAGVRARYRQRVERQRACDTNWREWVCVLQSRVKKGDGVTASSVRGLSDHSARVLAFDFTVQCLDFQVWDDFPRDRGSGSGNIPGTTPGSQG